MRKYFVMFVILIIILIIIVCFTKQPSHVIENIEVVSNKSLYESLELYSKTNESKIYLYGLKEVAFLLNNEKVTLKEYLNKNKIDDFMNMFELKDTLNDGGTNIYRNDDLTIIKCNTLDGNKDIFIGNKDMNYRENFCKENPYTFVKTYTIVDFKIITNDCGCIDPDPSYEISLYGLNEDVTEVTVKDLPIKLEKNNTYEFEFYIPNKVKVEDNIKSIFTKAKIISIRHVTNTNEKVVNMVPSGMTD